MKSHTFFFSFIPKSQTLLGISTENFEILNEDTKKYESSFRIMFGLGLFYISYTFIKRNEKTT